MPPKRRNEALVEIDPNVVPVQTPKRTRRKRVIEPVAEGDGDENSATEVTVSNKNTLPPLGLPELPVFAPKPRTHQNHHDAEPLLEADIDGTCPAKLFELVFTPAMLQVLSDNTNQYAHDRGVKQWKDTSPAKLRVFLGLIIWMGTMRLTSIRDYWSKADGDRYEQWVGKMSLNRYHLLIRNFHVAPPGDYTGNNWWRKTEPLASHCRTVFQQIFLPSSKASIDEQMARFSGRSSHTIKLPSKPIDQEYRMFTLADSGYTYNFTFQESRTSWLFIPSPPCSLGLNNTSSMVWGLAQSLPGARYCFDVYMDNYFTNVPLFQARLDHGVGAMGTARPNATKMPDILKVDKAKAKQQLSWEFYTGVIVGNDDVFASMWQNNNSVLLLSTIHDSNSFTLANRCRPKENSTNAIQSQKPLTTNGITVHTKKLPIPSIIDDYNHHMNGVDQADQLRSNYSTQQKTVRTWLPIFYWLLDVSLVNTYRIHQFYVAPEKPEASHEHFRRSVAEHLVSSDFFELHPPVRIETPQPPAPHNSTVVTSHSKPHEESFRLTGVHDALKVSSRRLCWLCWYMAQQLQDSVPISPVKTRTFCSVCGITLCTSYFSLYHKSNIELKNHLEQLK